VLDPAIHGSPALLAAGDGWLLLDHVDGVPVEVDDPVAMRLVYRRLADIHAAPPPALPETPLAAPDLSPLVDLVDRASRDPQAWEITTAIRSTAAALAGRPDLPPGGPPVLIHGDYQRGNWLIDGAGRARVLDWELAAVGPGVLDLYYLQPNGRGAGHAPAGPLAERAVDWYHERLLELGADPPSTASLLAVLPMAIAWGALAAARLRLEDYYAETPRARGPRGELPAQAASLVRYAAAQIGL
jgi:aminoglycoside phosphotransferase (APT) family kinase protein